MSFQTWFDSLTLQRKHRPAQHVRSGKRRRPLASRRLEVETLEDRHMLAGVFSIGSVAILEGNAGTQNAAVTVSLSAPHGNAVTVDYRTANGTATAGSDYNAVSGRLTFAKNQMSKTILVPVRGDQIVEPDEYFLVQLSNAKGGARIASGTGVFNIQDNEPRVSISDVSQVEGQSGTTAFNFTVSLSAAYDVPVTVNYTTMDGSAKAGTDYAAASGSVIFAPGDTSKTINVLVNGNRTPESDRTFFVNLTSPNSYAEITKNVGVGAIQDNEPRVSINSVSELEPESGNTTFNFTVNLSTAYDVPVTVNYTTVDGSGKAGTDYTAVSGSVVFAPGDTSKTIPVLVNGNPNAAPDRTFFVNVSSPNSYAEITNVAGVGTIIDRAPRISIGDAYNYYGESSFTFTVSLSAGHDQEVTVNFATIDGTAIAGVDYVATSGTLTFAPGETTKTITVGVIDPYAWDKYLTVQLSGVSTNVLVANSSANGYWYYDYGYYDPGYYYYDPGYIYDSYYAY